MRAGRSRDEIASRAARDIPEGWYVNLGIGIPLLVASNLPAGNTEMIFHSENGILGVGPSPSPGQVDPWLINAGKQPITLLPGASFCHQADSFAIIRGGHLDLCMLGAFQVAENGDIANWTTSLDDRTPAIGGAMDLAVGARRVWVLMEHVTRDGRPRLVRRCDLPLTATGVVQRVYTNLGVFDITERGFRVLEIVDGFDFATIQNLTDAKLIPIDNQKYA